MLADNPLGGAWLLINGADWTATSFSFAKASAYTLFARLAYLHIPDFELQDKKRIKVVPCLAYQSLAFARKTFDVERAAQEADFGTPFLVVTRYVVIIGVATSRFVIIAIRGTKYLYDWFTNLQAQQRRSSAHDRMVAFHGGFCGAISGCIPGLRAELGVHHREGVPVHVTGHSLGGAMAAILHAEWDAGELRTDCCYTFGMPRYGNRRATDVLRTPHHVYNDGDIVPTVPPRWLGYANCPTEYRSDGMLGRGVGGREGAHFLEWMWRLANGSGVGAHMMERYVEKVAMTAARELGVDAAVLPLWLPK